MLKSVCTLNKVVYLFIHFWPRRISVAALRLSLVVVSRGCFVALLGLPITVASFDVEHRLQ